MELTHELELQVDPVNDVWDSFEVTFDWIPPVPAFIGGLPEDCYPAEGDEIEVMSIKRGGLEKDCTEDFDHEMIENELWEAQDKWIPEPDYGDY